MPKSTWNSLRARWPWAMLLGLWLGQPRSCGYSALKGPPASLALDAEDTSTASQPFVSTHWVAFCWKRSNVCLSSRDLKSLLLFCSLHVPHLKGLSNLEDPVGPVEPSHHPWRQCWLVNAWWGPTTRKLVFLWPQAKEMYWLTPIFSSPFFHIPHTNISECSDVTGCRDKFKELSHGVVFLWF